jgi:hypothetical protein
MGFCGRERVRPSQSGECRHPTTGTGASRRLRGELHGLPREGVRACRPAPSCGRSSTTTKWSYTTSPPTPSCRLPFSRWSARDTWGWSHLFKAEHFAKKAGERGVRRAVHAGSCTLQVRSGRGDQYILAQLISSNSGWHDGWFYLCNDGD